MFHCTLVLWHSQAQFHLQTGTLEPRVRWVSTAESQPSQAWKRIKRRKDSSVGQDHRRMHLCERPLDPCNIATILYLFIVPVMILKHELWISSCRWVCKIKSSWQMLGSDAGWWHFYLKRNLVTLCWHGFAFCSGICVYAPVPVGWLTRRSSWSHRNVPRHDVHSQWYWCETEQIGS